MRKIRTVLAILLAASFWVDAVAADSAAEVEARDDAAVATLEQRLEELQRYALGRKLGPTQRSELTRERARVRDAIERLEAGESVDPATLEGWRGAR